MTGSLIYTIIWQSKGILELVSQLFSLGFACQKKSFVMFFFSEKNMTKWKNSTCLFWRCFFSHCFFPLLVILPWWQNEKRKKKKIEIEAEKESKSLPLPRKLILSQLFCYAHFSFTDLTKPVSVMFLKSNHLNIFSPVAF